MKFKNLSNSLSDVQIFSSGVSSPAVGCNMVPSKSFSWTTSETDALIIFSFVLIFFNSSSYTGPDSAKRVFPADFLIIF